jgi:hypothetical protein
MSMCTGGTQVAHRTVHCHIVDCLVHQRLVAQRLVFGGSRRRGTRQSGARTGHSGVTQKAAVILQWLF